ncbi:Carboxylesterase 5A [Dermatophagoides pteronyssinus]|uniref:Carboxylic ester hydrolase n=1 Tax=Dermatophagoides pteronyssinus TaxID=6956 RepID=A0ABQ8JLE4_DERPT|nr:Carboxylesterase 5A [Dermatophagoides pteronyssinus]
MNRYSIIVLFLNFCLISSFAADEEFAPIINLRHGKVRGLVRTIVEGDQKTKIHFYQGFRYGYANRFEKPMMVTSWPGGIYNATKEGNSCIQFGQPFVEKPTHESEDCLFLNVYKPVTNDKKLLPVMVWIYGGGFQEGSIFFSMYDSAHLASYGEVIVVSINYRLGPFGFLYGGDNNAPGNLGFHDQLLGLKWIQENIENFGGDPKSVTIFGESAGSISVSALIQAPLAEGLFHRAIMQSGAVISTLFDNKDVALRKTMKFAVQLNCDIQDNEQMVACLKTKSIEEIKKVVMNGSDNVLSGKLFSPMYGDEILPIKAILYENYHNRVDLIYGATHDEGSLFIILYYPELMNDKNTFTMEKVHEMISSLMSQINAEKSNEVIDYYTKTLNASNINEVRKVIGRIIGESMLLCPTMLFGQRMARDYGTSNKFYSYRLDKRSAAAGKFGCLFEWMGVCHGQDIAYVFDNLAIKSSPEDLKLSHEMMKAWTNFAKTGKPDKVGSIEWQQVYENGHKDLASVMLLNVENRMDKGTFKELCGFWENIYS